MKKCCWLPCFKSVNCIYRFWDMFCMQLKFYKSTSLERKKKFIRVFSEQHGFASQDSLVIGSNGWGFYGVTGAPSASKGGGVSPHLRETSNANTYKLTHSGV